MTLFFVSEPDRDKKIMLAELRARVRQSFEDYQGQEGLAKLNEAERSSEEGKEELDDEDDTETDEWDARSLSLSVHP